MTAYAPTVNAEALVINVLRDAGITQASAERIGTPLPFVLVEAAGGPSRGSDSPGWVQIYDAQISTWAATKAAAWQLYHDASMALRSYVRTAPIRPQGVLSKALVPEPNYSPDDDVQVDGRPAPRYFGVARVTVHPNQ